MPYVPVMCITEILVLRIDKSTKRYGRGVDIGKLGTNLASDIRYNALKELDVNGNTDLVDLGRGAGTARLYLVVTADDSKTSVVAYSLQVLSNLDYDVVKHTLVGENVGTCEGEVEEYYKTKLVADVEEIIVGIISAAPYSDSVEVSECASLKKLT